MHCFCSYTNQWPSFVVHPPRIHKSEHSLKTHITNGAMHSSGSAARYLPVKQSQTNNGVEDNSWRARGADNFMLPRFSVECACHGARDQKCSVHLFGTSCWLAVEYVWQPYGNFPVFGNQNMELNVSTSIQSQVITNDYLQIKPSCVPTHVCSLYIYIYLLFDTYICI